MTDSPLRPASPVSAGGLARFASAGWKALRLLFALWLFVGALQILKEGASGLALFEEGGVLVRNAASTLGLGWIGAMLTLSGSPAVATALTLRAEGHISEVQGFTMATGGRMGAAFVVLLVAVLFAARRDEGKRLAPVSTAVMTLLITFAMYIPGALIGLLLLQSESFQRLSLSSPPAFADLIEVIYGGVVERLASLPAPLLFVGGLVILVISFKLIDALVPELDESRFEGSRLTWLRSKWPMFFLGILVTIVTMSVSVALTVLVPLVGKGYVKREDLIPYIVGADIGTLVDKLLIAFVVGAGSLHPASPVRIILAELVGITLVGVLIMAFVYKPFKRFIWRSQRQMVKNKGRLALFTGGLLVTPLAIILAAALV